MERQKAGFDFAVMEAIEDLIGSTGGTVFDREQLFHIFDIEVGNAPVPNFSGHSKLLEYFHGFRERHAATPVQQIKIDRIDAKTFETALACDGQRERVFVVTKVYPHNASRAKLPKTIASANTFSAPPRRT